MLLPSPKNLSTRPAASIARAAQKTQSVIEDFQTKLTEVSQHGSLARLGAAIDTGKEAGAEQYRDRREDLETRMESEADLERQLADYFARSSAPSHTATLGPRNQNKMLEDLRKRVIDGVVDRILNDWTRGGTENAGTLRKEVLERLIERVLLQCRTGSAESAEASPS